MANIFNSEFVSEVSAALEALLDAQKPATRAAVAETVGLDPKSPDDCILVGQVVNRELTGYESRQKSGWVRSGTPKAVKESKNPGVRDAITADCKALGLDPTDPKVRQKVGAARRSAKLLEGTKAA